MATTYANGQIPSTALVAISGKAGARLLSGPAASWERGCDEVERRFGWRPEPSGPSDAYRELAVQIVTFLDRYVAAKTGGGFYGDVRWWNGVRYVRKKGKAAAAVPGTSNHGKGRAVDVAGLGGFSGIRYAQFASVFVPLGWSNAEGRSVDEPWHWVDLLSPELVSSGHATVPGITVPGSLPTITAPTPINPEDDMTPAQVDAMFAELAYIHKKLDDTFGKVQNVESILATEASLTPAGAELGVRGGMRAEIRRAWADVGTIANELRSLATQLGVKRL